MSMKTAPRTVKIAALTGAALAVISLGVLHGETSNEDGAAEPDRHYVLKIKKQKEFKKDEAAFDDALSKLSTDAVYQLRVKDDKGKEKEKKSGKTSARGDLTTTSRVAVKMEGFTAIGRHVTQQVSSNSTADMKLVLDQLQ